MRKELGKSFAASYQRKQIPEQGMSYRQITTRFSGSREGNMIETTEQKPVFVRNLVSASNPVYANEENTTISLTCVFKELQHLGPIPFAASASDVEAHGRDIFERAVAGEFGPISAYVKK
jgi:hypothetical protein